MRKDSFPADMLAISDWLGEGSHNALVFYINLHVHLFMNVKFCGFTSHSFAPRASSDRAALARVKELSIVHTRGAVVNKRRSSLLLGRVSQHGRAE